MGLVEVVFKDRELGVGVGVVVEGVAVRCE